MLEEVAEQSSSTVKPWISHGHQLFCEQGDRHAQESEWAHPGEPWSLGPLAGLSYKHPGPQEPGPMLVTLSCKGQWHLFTQNPTSLLGCAPSLPLAPQ